MPVPEFRQELPVAHRLAGFEQVQLAGGLLRAEVDNRLPVNLDTCRLGLPGIGELDLGPVAAGGTVSRDLDLAGAVLDSMLAGTVRLWSAGTGQDSVWVRRSDSVVVRLVVDSVRLHSGRLRLADSARMGTERSSVSYLRTIHRVRLDTARFEQGLVGFSLDNTMPVGLEVRLSVAEVGFDSTVLVDANRVTELPLDLSSRSYRNTDPDSSRLTINASVRAVGTGELVEFEPGQGFRTGFGTSDLGLAYLEGEALDTLWSPVLVETLAIDFPEDLAKVKFSKVWLHATGYSAADFSGVLELSVTAHGRQGDTATAVADIEMAGGTPQEPRASTGSIEVARLFNVEPEMLVVEGRAGLLGPGRAWSESWVSGRVAVQTPLRAKLLPDTFRFGPWDVPIDSSIRPRAGRDLKSVELVVHVVNHLPARVTGDLVLSSTTAEPVGVRLAVPLPDIDPQNGRVVAERDSVLSLSLDETQSRLFRAERFSAELFVYIPETDTITLTARDWFRIEKSYARLELELGPR
jgi:hypothetical protein